MTLALPVYVSCVYHDQGIAPILKGGRDLSCTMQDLTPVRDPMSHTPVYHRGNPLGETRHLQILW